MKKLFNFFAAAALVGGLMMTQSCTKTCDPGYEGSDCKTESRAKYTGTVSTSWRGYETCTYGTDAYSISISKSSSSDVTKLIISNLYNSSFSATAAANSTSFTADADQQVSTGVNTVTKLVSGTGSLVGDSLLFTYTLRKDSSNGTVLLTNTCSFKAGKQ